MTTLGDGFAMPVVLAQAFVDGFQGFVTSTEFLLPFANLLSTFLTSIVTALLAPFLGIAS